MVALHLAYQALQRKEIDMALAGGVTLYLTQKRYMLMNQAGMLSKRDACHPFDNRADGFIPGEGVGVVVLKRLADAIADKDNILAVIRSSGINQDGKTNGITAPSSLSQAELEKEVYRKGNINPADIGLIETHGTGTALGDPIEINALIDAFGDYTTEKQFCAIGSVKANVGHTSAAAGMASLIKVVQAMRHQKLPPNIGFEQANDQINFADSPFYVNVKLQDWKQRSGSRLAAD